MSHLRHQIFRIFFSLVYRFKNERLVHWVRPMFSWLHPRNPQGILAMVTIIFFLLKRYTNVKVKAEIAYRRKFWRNMMRRALTYEEWVHATRMLDKETPKMNESDLYDEEVVRNKLQEVHHRREEGSLRDIMFCMRADLLHKEKLHVPKLIKEYIDEVPTQLRMVCDSDSEELSLEEKLAFMHETRHAFGRTALGGGGGARAGGWASLGSFHVGVVKTLVERKLLPRIIACSSDSWHSLQFFYQMGGIFTVVKRVMTREAVHEIRQLQMMLKHLTSNLTFQEAYDMTGRILGITVCSPRKHEPPRCLNYLTSPHVVIWSAVTASRAIPGLFEAQELMAKDKSGEIVPYHPPFILGPEEGSMPVRWWRDGSLEIDLPIMQLKELFNINHFIVSQANPHIAPLLRLKEFVRACGGNFAAKLAHLAEMEMKHGCNQILELGFPLGGIARLFPWWRPSSLQKAANQGRRCTWEKPSAIKANCGIDLALDQCVVILNHMRRLKRSAERAAASSSHGLASTYKFSASRRIPSWNCIARENSSGSLEEDLTGDGKSLQTHRNIHDGSDSESERVDFNSWTRSGGPLMRTTSANKLIDFVQDLDIDAELNRSVLTNPNSMTLQMGGNKHYYQSPRSTTPERSPESVKFGKREFGSVVSINGSSITVTEGDLLQPERVHNGIVFNVVKKETLSSRSSHDLENYESEVAECVQLDSPEKDMDARSASEYDDADITSTA
ncbi:unnamed protein product [Malus baccata var. baccata]